MAQICSTCLEIIPSNYIRLDDGVESVEIRRKLAVCVPDAFDMLDDPVMCNSCYTALNSSYAFISQCRRTNECIVKYMETVTMNGKTKLLADELPKVSKYSKRSSLQNIDINVLKKNVSVVNITETEKPDVQNKENNNTILHQNTDIYSGNEPDKSLQNVDINIDCDGGTSVSKKNVSVVNITEIEKPDVQNKENINTHKKAIIKDCCVVLERLDLKEVQKTVKKRKMKKEYSTALHYVCDICDYKTRDNSNFRRHMRMHNDDKPYSCDKCDYSTSVKSNLTMHMATHKQIKPYQCNKCEFNTAHQSNLKKHMLIHEDKLFNCDECHFKTTNKSAFKSHVCTPKESQTYQCDICKICCSDSYKLQRHKLTHLNKKEYKCRFCEYKSVRKDTLQRHVSRKHQEPL